jgi:hypothetical protein
VFVNVLAELPVSEPDIRPTIINVVLRDVAVKQDVERLRGSVERWDRWS